jgi:hypothetical protein
MRLLLSAMRTFFPLLPGEHTVSCYFRCVFLPRAAESSTVRQRSWMESCLHWLYSFRNGIKILDREYP